VKKATKLVNISEVKYKDSVLLFKEIGVVPSRTSAPLVKVNSTYMKPKV